MADEKWYYIMKEDWEPQHVHALSHTGKIDSTGNSLELWNPVRVRAESKEQALVGFSKAYRRHPERYMYDPEHRAWAVEIETDSNIEITTLDGEEISALLIDMPQLNKISRKTIGLRFIKNVMDDADGGKTYMWFMNQATFQNYLLEF